MSSGLFGVEVNAARPKPTEMGQRTSDLRKMGKRFHPTQGRLGIKLRHPIGKLFTRLFPRRPYTNNYPVGFHILIP